MLGTIAVHVNTLLCMTEVIVIGAVYWRKEMFKGDLGGLHPSIKDRVAFHCWESSETEVRYQTYVSKGMWSVSSIKRTQMLCHSILSVVLVKGRHHDAQFVVPGRQRGTRAVSRSGGDALLAFHQSNNQCVLNFYPLPTQTVGHWIRTKYIEVQANLSNGNLAVCDSESAGYGGEDTIVPVIVGCESSYSCTLCWQSHND